MRVGVAARPSFFQVGVEIGPSTKLASTYGRGQHAVGQPPYTAATALARQGDGGFEA